MIYFSYIHSIIAYGIIFWDNSPGSDEIFKLQKRAIRIITNSHSSTSYRNLFKELNILPLHSQYILALAVFVAKNIDDFTANSDIHSINTPLLRLTKYQHVTHQRLLLQFLSAPEDGRKKRPKHVEQYFSYK